MQKVYVLVEQDLSDFCDIKTKLTVFGENKKAGMKLDEEFHKACDRLGKKELTKKDFYTEGDSFSLQNGKVYLSAYIVEKPIINIMDMRELYFQALLQIQKELKIKDFNFEPSTYDKDIYRPCYRNGYIINISNLDPLEKTFSITYDVNGTLMTDDFFVIESTDEYMEYIFENVYNYVLGEKDLTSEEYLDKVLNTLQI